MRHRTCVWRPFRHARERRRSSLRYVALIVSLSFCHGLGGCAKNLRRFELRQPIWQENDRSHLPQKPREHFSGLIADGADKLIFRPLSNLFLIKPPTEPRDVNSIDEVPNSTWFTNRLGAHNLSPEAAAGGACASQPTPKIETGAWTVIAAKPDGANPGFFIKSAEGNYLLKVDGPVQPQRATAADVIGSRIYWAAGYWVPCNQIVYFRKDTLRIGKNATTTGIYGDKRPITQGDVDRVLASAFRTKDGAMRASLSKFIPGEPLGPFSYEGVRSDDANDRIPHEERRSLRASRILAAWIDHHDARRQNSLDAWVKNAGRSYIRHYFLDFGDCLGGRWAYDSLSRRTGHSYLLDYEHLFVDLVTLGIAPRPWYSARINRQAEIFGYFSERNFSASKWRPDYPNPAFQRMTFRDALWMVRIISRFTEAHIRAIVAEAKLTNPRAEAYLVSTLLKRRKKILREYLRHYAPLDEFQIVRRTPPSSQQSLCFVDLANKHSVSDPRTVVYKTRLYGGQTLERELGWLQFEPDPKHPHYSCILLPIGEKRPAMLAPPRAADDHDLRYGVLKIFIHQEPAIPPTSSIWLHFYDLGEKRGFRLVGIDRRPRAIPPDIY